MAAARDLHKPVPGFVKVWAKGSEKPEYHHPDNVRDLIRHLGYTGGDPKGGRVDVINSDASTAEVMSMLREDAARLGISVDPSWSAVRIQAAIDEKHGPTKDLGDLVANMKKIEELQKREDNDDE